MKLIKRLDQYERRYVIFCESVKNNVVNEGTYIRLVYTTPTFATSGLHVSFKITPHFADKCYNKYKLTFDKQAHKDIVEKIKYIEEDIVKQVGIENKTPHYKITEQVKYGYLKLSMEEDASPQINKEMEVLLKISGVWETDSCYGVTYKFEGR